MQSMDQICQTNQAYSLTQKFLKEILVLFLFLSFNIWSNKMKTDNWTAEVLELFVTQVRKEAFKREEGGPLLTNENRLRSFRPSSEPAHKHPPPLLHTHIHMAASLEKSKKAKAVTVGEKSCNLRPPQKKSMTCSFITKSKTWNCY